MTMPGSLAKVLRELDRNRSGATIGPVLLNPGNTTIPPPRDLTNVTPPAIFAAKRGNDGVVSRLLAPSPPSTVIPAMSPDAVSALTAPVYGSHIPRPNVGMDPQAQVLNTVSTKNSSPPPSETTAHEDEDRGSPGILTGEESDTMKETSASDDVDKGESLPFQLDDDDDVDDDVDDDIVVEDFSPPGTDKSTSKKKKKKSTVSIPVESVTWKSVQIGDDGDIATICGVAINKLSSKQLRSVCSRLKVRQVKNFTKARMIKTMNTFRHNRIMLTAGTGVSPFSSDEDDAIEVVEGSAKVNSTPRKEKQCAFRLVNVLFDDDFADKLARLGDTASREVLDSGKAGSDQHFWEAVEAAFVNPGHERFDSLDFQSDPMFATREDIDPGKIVRHGWRKLRKIWKQLNADYKAALNRYTMSGTHEQNFYAFCSGKLDLYYLRLKLDERPQLTATVVADLPDGTFYDSANKTRSSVAPGKDTVQVNCCDSGPQVDDVLHKRKKPRTNSHGEYEAQNETAKSVKDLAKAIVESSSKHEVTLEYEEAQTTLAIERVEILRTNDKREESRALYAEYDRLNKMQRDLRKDLKQENEAYFADVIRTDLEGVLRKKDTVARKLGMRDFIV